MGARAVQGMSIVPIVEVNMASPAPPLPRTERWEYASGKERVLSTPVFAERKFASLWILYQSNGHRAASELLTWSCAAYVHLAPGGGKVASELLSFGMLTVVMELVAEDALLRKQVTRLQRREAASAPVWIRQIAEPNARRRSDNRKALPGLARPTSADD